MVFKILLPRSVQTPNSDKNWQTSCPLQTFVSNISRHFGFHYRTGPPGQLGLRVAGFPGHWVAGSQNVTQFHVCRGLESRGGSLCVRAVSWWCRWPGAAPAVRRPSPAVSCRPRDALCAVSWAPCRWRPTAAGSRCAAAPSSPDNQPTNQPTSQSSGGSTGCPGCSDTRPFV